VGSDGNLCFSPQQLTLLTGAWLVIQGVIVYLFRGWLASLNDQVREAREQRNWALSGWEDTVGAGEKVERRRRAPRPKPS
jgi:hypothetical protein